MSAFLLFLVLAVMPCLAQVSPTFKSLRYDEDYSKTNDSTYATKWYSKMKHLDLSDENDLYASFGGQVRYQYFYIENENWGDSSNDRDGYVLSRFLFHADVHFGKKIRAFVQTQSSLADGKLDVSPVDENPLDVHQAFVDFNLLDLEQKKTSLVLRTGRQELSYGSQRLVSVREGPNNRQSFDGIKSILAISKFQADLFYTHYVRASEDIFDDESNQDRQFWGSYLKFSQVPKIGTLELYYLGVYRQDVAFEGNLQGNETRHSVGLRLENKVGGWRYDFESVYQFGRFAMADISAWTASINASYRFNSVVLQPEIGLKAEFISGDKTSGDGKINTFNPLFPRGAYFGLAAIVGPSNLIDAHPSLRFSLAKGLDWTIDYDMFWRYSTDDGLYAPNSSLIFPSGDSGENEIGQQLATDLSWQPNSYLMLRAEFTWFKAGKYLASVTPGQDILFSGLTLQLQF